MPPTRSRDGKGKTVEVTMRIWFKEENGHIVLQPSETDGKQMSSVTNDPNSHRYHRHLYASLANILASTGAPHPDLTELAADPPPPRKKKQRVIQLDDGK